VLRHVQLAILSADHVPTTLTGSCGSSPGITCRLVWNLSHNGQAASLTRDFLNGPVHLLLKVAFVIALALIIRAVVHRVINRLTERAAQSILPQFRNGVMNARLVPGRLTRRRPGGGGMAGVDSLEPLSQEAAAVAEAESSVPAVGAVGAEGTAAEGTGAEGTGAEGTGAEGTAGGGQPDDAAQAGSVAVAAARAEGALVAERRHQRVRALGSVLRSAASVTIFTIAGVVVLGDLGINLAPLLASAGVVGIAVGFGAQNLVRDYLSGIFMLVEDQYGVGDVITVGDATGTVETVTLRITRLRDLNGIVWHVRNGAIERVGNESQGWARAVIDFPVPYAADLVTIRAMLADAAETMWNERSWRAVMLEQPEVWGAQEVSSAEVTMRIVVKTAPLRQWEVEREMRARLKTALDAAGVNPAETPAPSPSASHRRPASGKA
jgi:small-conductance mechanosensitive channel